MILILKVMKNFDDLIKGKKNKTRENSEQYYNQWQIKQKHDKIKLTLALV
jgi:hypothetical protein